LRHWPGSRPLAGGWKKQLYDALLCPFVELMLDIYHGAGSDLKCAAPKLCAMTPNNRYWIPHRIGGSISQF